MASPFGRFFLDDQPQASFFNSIQPFSNTPIRRRFFQSQFDPVMGAFMARLGGMARGGTLDPMNLPRFDDFTKSFDFNRLFQQAPRSQRGESAQFFNPRTRFLFGF